MRRLTQQELTIVNLRYPNAVPRSVWIIWPGLKNGHKKAKFVGKCDNVLLIKTDDSWIALEDVLIQSKPRNPGALKEFIGAYINQALYNEPIYLEGQTGEELTFD